MTNFTTGDSNTPASRPSTFAEIIGTGYFPPQLCTVNVHDDEATSSTASDLNQPENRPCPFAELVGTGFFRQPLCTGNVNDDDVTSSIAGDSNPPEPAEPSPFTEANGTGNFRRQLMTGDVDNDDPFYYDDNLLQQFATWIETLCIQSKNEGSSKGRRKKASAGTRLNVFPPLLTSLNRNGRQRFTLEKVRDGERLVISQVPNDLPELVREPKENGGVKMMLVVDGGDYDSDTEDEELNSDGKRAGNRTNDQLE